MKLALFTELIETLNRIMRVCPVNDCVYEEEIELKKTALDIFQGLLEGQGKKKQIYQRVLSVVHLDIIVNMALPSVDENGEEIPREVMDKETESLRAECLVLLQMLVDFDRSLPAQLGITDRIKKVDPSRIFSPHLTRTFLVLTELDIVIGGRQCCERRDRVAG